MGLVGFELFSVTSNKGGVGAERIDKIGDKIFFGGASTDGFFFVFNDDFVVGNFNDFMAMNGKLWVEKTFNCWAFDDDLLNGKIFGSDGEINNFTKFGTFFSFDFKTDEVEIEF